ncbi:hypothetical protein MACH24_29890 [Erythrobacter sp. Dej080120_24]|jgi:hypothetical protein|uniref:DUF3833 family protein n=1 Tax=Erythrobacter sp. Dej080120_24 TaxID=3024837 RepID=UPI0004D5C3BB|nr:hypothetical protein EH30_10850 [Erythrobacter sp. JL475]BDW83551.1 hypothetical protein MACH24_29890 [Erythrobacter sp. Dej080120_24]
MARRGRITFGLAALAALALSGCASLPDDFAMVGEAASPVFDPLVFFNGRLEGQGTLDKGLLGTVPIRVESTGSVTPSGVLTLVQVIHEGEKPARTRTWEMRRLSEGRYEASLTDADGPVEIWTKGNTLNIRYTMDGSFIVKQRLTLSPDGQRATNAMQVDLLGARVAMLSEVIVRE